MSRRGLSEESARARSEELRVGGKALLLKVDGEFRLFVLSADRKLDSNAIRDRFRCEENALCFAGRTDATHRTCAGIGASVPVRRYCRFRFTPIHLFSGMIASPLTRAR